MRGTEKAELRRAMLARRQTVEPAERLRLDRAVQEGLIRSGAFQTARTVLLYQPVRGEAATDLIARAAAGAGKRLALPRVAPSRRLGLYLWGGNPAQLAKGSYGIPEPDLSWPQVLPGEIDLVVTPGVAFDPSGRRLGYGGGYYDRLLADVRAANPGARLIGLAYGFQLLAELPWEEHDALLDGVVTEAGFAVAQR